MISSLLAKVGAAILAPLVFLTTVFAPEPQPAPLGVQLPSATAVFETSLASPITAAATSMTLSSNSIRGGGTLSGYQCFTIDEGSAQAEYVCGTVSGTAVSSLERGLSPANGTTTDTDVAFSHRRGASVKITDFPVLQRLILQNSGSGTYESALRYATSVSTTTLALDGQNLASVAYANYLSFGGVAQASESTGGFIELATGQEAASSTQSGSAARLALSTAIATSTGGQTGNHVVVTKSNGKIDGNFCCDGGTTTFSGTVFGVGLRSSTSIYVATTTDYAFTYTKPAGLISVTFEAWSGGGGGAGYDTDGTSCCGVSGGGGGYAKKTVMASAIGSTIAVTVGGFGDRGTSDPSPSSGSNGGTTTVTGIFNITGGQGGSTAGGTASGGTATGGDLNFNGGAGTNSANGGNVMVGGATYLTARAIKTGAVNHAPVGYGYGGPGGYDNTGDPAMDGGPGAVIITEYF